LPKETRADVDGVVPFFLFPFSFFFNPLFSFLPLRRRSVIRGLGPDEVVGCMRSAADHLKGNVRFGGVGDDVVETWRSANMISSNYIRAGGYPPSTLEVFLVRQAS